MRLHDLTTRAVGAALVAGMLAGCSGTGSGFAPTGGMVPNGLTSSDRMDTFRDMGRAGASTQVNVAIVLKYRNQDELDKLVEDQTDPSSGQFHHFLSQQQFLDKFGATAAQYQATIKELQDAGFTVTHTFNNRTVIDATAPAPSAEKLFSTQIHNVQMANGNARYIETVSPTIPAQLENVYAVVGLDSAHSMHPLYQFSSNRSNPIRPRAVPNKKAPILLGPDNGYGPAVWRLSYNFPAKALGQKQATGVVGDADFLDTDLSGFLSYFKEKQKVKTVRVPVDGGAPPNQISPDTVETNLDTQTVIGINPDAALYMYTVPPGQSNINNFTDMYNQAVQDNKVDTVNTSYSQCETAFDPNFPKAADKIFEQGGAEGITFHASSGDYGVYTYGCSNSVSVGTPTDTPHGVSIGGTTLAIDRSTGKFESEVGWDSTGGGVSVVFPVPSYQKGVKNIIKTGRNIPDVAFDANPNTGASLFYDGSFQGPIGGTSLASPIFGAGITDVDQTNGSRAGYLNTTMYKEWDKVGYGKGAKAYFRDITVGSIGVYQAQKGYDQMSGIGVMLFDTFGPLLK